MFREVMNVASCTCMDWLHFLKMTVSVIKCILYLMCTIKLLYLHKDKLSQCMIINSAELLTVCCTLTFSQIRSCWKLQPHNNFGFVHVKHLFKC